MVRDPAKTLEETPRVDLIIAAEMLRARRNGALFLALVLAVLIGWQGWNRLLFLLPGAITLYAAIPQINLCLIGAELKRRRSEAERDTRPAPEDDPGEDPDCNLEEIENELSHLCHEACLARTEEDKELVRKRLLALRSRLDTRQSRKESEAENGRLKLAKNLRERDPKGYREDLLPTFDEWMSLEGCSGAKGAVRDTLLISYTEELEQRYTRELGGQAWEDTCGCEGEDDSAIQDSFDPDFVIARAEAKKRGPLTPREHEEFQHMVLELEEAERKLADIQQQGSSACSSEDT